MCAKMHGAAHAHTQMHAGDRAMRRKVAYREFFSGIKFRVK